jgi:hypothetical protein
VGCASTLACTLACTGSLDEGTGDTLNSAGTGGTSAGGGSSGIISGNGGSAIVQPPTNPNAIELLTNPPAEPVAADIACTDQAVVPAGRISRLSAEGYRNSINDTLAYANVDASSAPLDPVSEKSRFATNSIQNVVSQPWAEWLYDQGESAATQVASTLPAQHACMIAAGASTDCVQAFIQDYATKLFRRPLTTDEVTRYQTAYTQWVTSMTPTDATVALLQAWTMSPNHVFRTELGNRATGEVELTQYEIASQISFLFANTSPDALLLADAQQNKLSDPAVVKGHAQRLLATGGHQVLKTFFYEFLHLRELDGGALDPAQRPLVPSMEAETANFVENVVFTQGGGLDQLLSSTVSTVDPALGAFYGVTAGNQVNTERSGLLHQAAFLNARRDATRRGLFVRGELLCSPPAQPPPDAVAVAMMLVFDENDTARDIFEVINESGPVCATCHATFVPFGLSFEHYDQLGQHRDQHNGQTLDVTGMFPTLGDLGGTFADSEDMVQKIVASKQGQMCFSKRFVSYLQGRDAHGVLDGCLISRAHTQMINNQFSLQSFMLELTQDPSFYRRINLTN